MYKSLALTVLNNLIGQQSLMYDLNSFNCTNIVINALNSNDIHLPATNTNNMLFNGNNPADLGEDIRVLNLDNFSENNSNRKVIRKQSNDNSQKPSTKSGGC